jgi:hypothetical protein
VDLLWASSSHQSWQFWYSMWLGGLKQKCNRLCLSANTLVAAAGQNYATHVCPAVPAHTGALRSIRSILH